MGLNQLRVRSSDQRTYPAPRRFAFPILSWKPSGSHICRPGSFVPLGSQVVYLQYLTYKLLQILDLWRALCEQNFSVESRKIFFSKNLARGVSDETLQNLEPLGLMRKILRNNDLPAAWRSRIRLLGIRMMGYWGCRARGQMSQGRTCWLWKSAERPV